MLNETKDFTIDFLKERAKELESLYRVDEALKKDSLPEILTDICRFLPRGFCNIRACSVMIALDDRFYAVKPIPDHPVNEIRSDIVVNGRLRGYVRATYTKDEMDLSVTSFLAEEEKLLAAVANKISNRIFYEELEPVESRSNWEAILLFLQNTDHTMLLYICEKMLTLLAKNDPACIRDIFIEMNWAEHDFQGEINFPRSGLPAMDTILLSNCVFRTAKNFFEDSEIFHYISLWIYQGKTYELIKLVDRKDSDVKDISKALTQYLKAVKTNDMSSKATKRWLIVELVRRFLTDNPKMIENARKYLCVSDFCELLDHIICSPKSLGRIGGKATGFFLANKILQSHIENNPAFSNIKMVKTWYIASDELENFLHDNHLDELNEHKYRDILEIRISYPKVVHSIKNGQLSPYISGELNHILDQSEGKPLIIRSSSLLEDQKNTAFSGKYKSLFVTNTGTRTERLNSLIDGILEVYASMFSPDSIQYRKEHGLLDYSEQMGVMIQEVVGRRTGRYFFPLYAGVGFSNNEFRWSPRIRREDGLLRMVMGLGTRAVDRVGDDFPILISPGQPKLRVNHVPQEMQKYSPQMMDVLDMEKNQFITVSISDIIRNYGSGIPWLNHAVSFLTDDFITEYNKFSADSNNSVIVTFDGLIHKTPVISQIRTIMSLLVEKLGFPVDVKFASDGENFYILQCRPQSKSRDNLPVAIPTEIPAQNTVFTADKYISNGKVTGIKTVVYVDPDEYGGLEDHQDLVRVGNAVSELNRILYRKSFILMGPGRWGSRGDIKLGVQVTYSDISNTAMLIEIAKKKSRHQPELSFGTHFFQDLVEANIKYLPLYPEDDGIVFKSAFFHKNTNALESMLPAYSDLSNVIKVINIPENYFKKELIILMNADLEKAVAFLEQPQKPDRKQQMSFVDEYENKNDPKDSEGWKWRYYMAEKIASLIDMQAFSVKGIYLFGSTSSCTASLNSDIDLLVHLDGTEEQKQELDIWLKGWSQALSEMNYLKTGYQSNGLLDVHYITDRDIENKDSFASKINSVYDPAVVLRLRDLS